MVSAPNKVLWVCINVSVPTCLFLFLFFKAKVFLKLHLMTETFYRRWYGKLNFTKPLAKEVHYKNTNRG